MSNRAIEAAKRRLESRLPLPVQFGNRTLLQHCRWQAGERTRRLAATQWIIDNWMIVVGAVVGLVLCGSFLAAPPGGDKEKDDQGGDGEG